MKIKDFVEKRIKGRWPERWWLGHEVVIHTTNGVTWTERDMNRDINPNIIEALGSTGIDADGMAKWVCWEIDVGHGEDVSRADAIAAATELSKRLGGMVDVRNSTGGEGVHCRFPIGIPRDKEWGLNFARGVTRLVVGGHSIFDKSALGRQCLKFWTKYPKRLSFHQLKLYEYANPLLFSEDHLDEIAELGKPQLRPQAFEQKGFATGDIDRYVAKCKYNGGSRNEELNRLAFILTKKFSPSIEKLEEVCLQWNATLTGEGPLGEQEVKSTVLSAYRGANR